MSCCLLGGKDGPKRMLGTIGIPHPVVYIETAGLFAWTDSVVAAVVFSVFGNIDHTLMCTIESCVEGAFLGMGAPFDPEPY